MINFEILYCVSDLLTCVSMHCRYTYDDQKRSPDPLELELQMLGATLWMLGIEFQSPGRAASVPNHPIAQPYLQTFLCKLFIGQT